MAAPRDLVSARRAHDHGKTALVRALTGVVQTAAAEKLRGITIDLGFASLELGDCSWPGRRPRGTSVSS